MVPVSIVLLHQKTTKIMSKAPVHLVSDHQMVADQWHRLKMVLYLFLYFIFKLHLKNYLSYCNATDSTAYETPKISLIG